MFPLKKIRDRAMVLICLASILPVLILGGFTLVQARSDLAAQAVEHQKALALAIRQGLTTQVWHYARQLERFAETPPVQSMDRVRQEPAVFRFLDQNSLFFSCYIYDLEGTIVSLAYRNRDRSKDHLVGKNLLRSTNQRDAPSQAAFRKAVETRRLAVAETVITERRQSMLLVYVPIPSFVDRAETAGVISVGILIDGAAIQEIIEGFMPAGDSFLLLTDIHGKVLGRKGKGLPEGLEEVRPSRVPDGPALETTRTSIAGREFLVSLGRVPGMNILVLAGAPTDEVFVFLRKMLWGLGC